MKSILFAIAALLTAGPLSANVFDPPLVVEYTLSFENDPNELVIQTPANWVGDISENKDHLYDIFFIHESGERECKLFFGEFDVGSDTLDEAMDGVVEDLYETDTIRNVTTQSSVEAQYLRNTFEVEEINGDILHVCATVFYFEHYLIGVVIENKNNSDSLAADFNDIAGQIYLREIE